MKSTTELPTRGTFQDGRRQRKAASLNPSNIDQTALLVMLEEKYGNKKVRLDAAHRTPPTPHTRAAQFRNYVHWLIEQTSTTAPAFGSAPESIANTNIDIVDSQIVGETRNLEYAAPDILATADPTILADGTRKNISTGVRSQLSTPISNSGFSLKRLTRVDSAHALHSRPSGAKSPAVSDFVSQPNYLRNKSRTENGPGVTPTNEHQQAVVESKLLSIDAAPNPTSSLPASQVAWEVDDFKWPEMIAKIACTQTQSAGAMAKAATQVLSANNQRLTVIGAGRGRGTTTIALYLAKVLAARSKRVLLVDADLSKPDLTQVLGLPSRLSWMNVINENRACGEAIIRSVGTGVCVMPVSKLVSRVTWPDYIYDSLGEILDGVRQHFDYVIIDVGPASQLFRELSRPHILVDGAMLVHNVRVPDLPTYVRNQDDLKSFGIKKLVVAENFANRKAA